MWIFQAATTALLTALFATTAEPEGPVIDLDEVVVADESGDAAREEASLVFFIDDSAGLDLLEDGAVRLSERGDFVVIRGPSQVEIKVMQGQRGGAMSTSYIIRRIEYGTLYRLTNNETAGWDIDIEVRLVKPG
ncbi:hypothetical protein OV079_24145 [Nannocystis pusilla]|uniref:Uncharacterized protein n=1 Tax=Nannocystis pusilla TaxID=889268 RepID=A0A9X3ERN5_9BACT|nr:hypothetical protein [Nannocystis pusilla]MCY1008596.1 hypothetical protein [Nannocystis pusilla]